MRPSEHFDGFTRAFIVHLDRQAILVPALHSGSWLLTPDSTHSATSELLQLLNSFPISFTC